MRKKRIQTITYIPFIIVVIILIAIPLTYLLVQSRQEIRQRAFGPSPSPYEQITMFLKPSTQTPIVNQDFTVDVWLSSQLQPVSGSQIFVTFDPAKITAQDIVLASESPYYDGTEILELKNIDNNSGVVSVSVLSPPEQKVINTGILAEIVFKAKTITLIPTEIKIDTESQVAGLKSDISILEQTENTQVIINFPTSPTPTPVPTPSPTPTPIPSISPSPTLYPTPTPTRSPTPTPSQTSTPSPTSNPSPSVSPSPTLNPTPTPTKSPTPTPSQTSTPSPTSNPSPSILPSTTPTPSPASIIFKAILESVRKKVNSDKLFTIELSSADSEIAWKDYRFQVDDLGIWTNVDKDGDGDPDPMTDTALIPGTYNIFIKGPVHLRNKFPGIEILPGLNIIDLTGTKLLAADGYDDNKINSYDFNLLITNFGCKPGIEPTGKSCSPLSSDYDFDLDVDIFDYSYLVSNYQLQGD